MGILVESSASTTTSPQPGGKVNKIKKDKQTFVLLFKKDEKLLLTAEL